MKIIFILLIISLISIFSKAQNYIGKNINQIIIEESFIVNPDSTEVWKKENVSIDITELKTNNKLRIHDPNNSKVITCLLKDNICIYFSIVYYNFNKSHIEDILIKKYNYNGKEKWHCYNYNLELCLNEKPGKIYIIEACYYFTENISNEKINQF